MDSTNQNSDVILIKKYGNRRLYSTESSSYITLAELEIIVHSGKSIKVVEVATDEDITAQVLTQILVEGGKARSIPVGFLEKIIRQRADLIGNLVTLQSQQIEKSVDVARQAQDEMLKMMQRVMQVGGGMWNPFMGFPNSRNSDEQAQKVRDLEREIEELKRKMNS